MVGDIFDVKFYKLLDCKYHDSKQPFLAFAAELLNVLNLEILFWHEKNKRGIYEIWEQVCVHKHDDGTTNCNI